jgi:hypothetical protein
MDASKLLLTEVKEMARKFLHLNRVDGNMIDLAAAAVVANDFDSDPLWLFLNGPPSHAKTEVLAGLSGFETVKTLSTLTPQTLISGKTVKRKRGVKENCSLLPQLTGKLVVIKDFGSVLTINRDARSEIYAQLREIYDGKFEKAFGTGEVVRWEGKVGIIAAVTPAIDRQSSLGSILGERFLHYRVYATERFASAKTALHHSTGISEARESFRAKMTDFLGQFRKLTQINVEMPPDTDDRLAALSCFCSAARSGVLRDRYSQVLEAMPEPEGPSRLAKQLKVLGIALATVRHEAVLSEDTYQLVAKVATDSMPRLRFATLKALWELYTGKPGWYSTKDVAERAEIPTTTAKYKLENLHVLGLLARKWESGKETAPYYWAPTEETSSMIQISGALDDGSNPRSLTNIPPTEGE